MSELEMQEFDKTASAIEFEKQWASSPIAQFKEIIAVSEKFETAKPKKIDPNETIAAIKKYMAACDFSDY